MLHHLLLLYTVKHTSPCGKCIYKDYPAEEHQMICTGTCSLSEQWCLAGTQLKSGRRQHISSPADCRGRAASSWAVGSGRLIEGGGALWLGGQRALRELWPWGCQHFTAAALRVYRPPGKRSPPILQPLSPHCRTDFPSVIFLCSLGVIVASQHGH